MKYNCKGCDQMGKVYAVKSGRKTGIFQSWKECEKQVKGYSGAQYKSFTSAADAKSYLKGNIDSVQSENLVNSNDLLVYVDGSYSKAKGAGGYGCVMVQGDRVIHRVSNSINMNDGENLWNVAGEIAGAVEGVSWAIKNKYKKVFLHYDYEGIRSWAEGSWAAKRNLTKEYVETIKELGKLIEIKFVKVKAHSGNEYNDMADLLAKQSLEKTPVSIFSKSKLIEDSEKILDKSTYNKIVGDVSEEKLVVNYKGYVINDKILKKIAKYYWKLDSKKIMDLAKININLEIGIRKSKLRINYMDKQDNTFEKHFQLEGEQDG